MPDIVVDDVHFYVPEGYERPTTVLDALLVGRAVIQEEGRWIKESLYSIERPEEDPNTPYCDSWGVCAMGAVIVATEGASLCTECPGGPHYMVSDVEGRTLAAQAIDCLGRATEELFGVEHVWQLNDRTDSTLDQVIEVFDQAIKDEQERETGLTASATAGD